MRIFKASRRDDDPRLELRAIDVIFAITASPTHDRCFAHYSDYIEREDDIEQELQNRGVRDGLPFDFNIDPCRNKEVYQNGVPVEPHRHVFPELHEMDDTNEDFRMVHDFFATRPGRVALNVLGARLKTYRHEFAHAMSSLFHGTIKDEYVDYFLVTGETVEQIPHFFVNRIERRADAMPIPAPKVFAEYNCTRYHSDCAHPSAEEGWLGYFPDRYDRNISCIMDTDNGSFRFDDLLAMFIYDRLMAKVNRS